jgi:hypothetical protein
LALATETNGSEEQMNKLKIPAGCSYEDELRARFKIVCRRCGSEDIAINMEASYSCSEYTSGGGTVQIGCNACKQNDFYASL